MKKLALILVLAVTAVAIPLIVYFVGQQQELRSKAAPATHLTITPPSGSHAVGEQFIVNVEIDTGTNQVSGFDFEMKYDPAILRADSMVLVDQTTEAGAFLPNKSVLSELKNDTTTTPGRIQFIYYMPVSANALSGTGVVAKMTFTALAQTSGTPTIVDFDRSLTEVGGVGEATNVIDPNGGMSPASYTITEGTGSTPTPTPTTGGATPTPTTAGATATPTPTTGTGGGNPTNSPTMTPTPTTSAGGTTTLAVTSPANGATVTTSTPTLSGTAKASSTVTVVLTGATSATGVVTATTGGTWSYSPGTLSDGSYTVTLTERASDGTTRTATSSFTVNTQGVPETGTMETTFMIITVAISLLLIGAGVSYFPVR